MRILLFCGFLFAGTLLAAPTITFRTQKLEEASVTAFSKGIVSIVYAEGIVKIPIEELSEADLKKLNAESKIKLPETAEKQKELAENLAERERILAEIKEKTQKARDLAKCGPSPKRDNTGNYPVIVAHLRSIAIDPNSVEIFGFSDPKMCPDGVDDPVARLYGVKKPRPGGWAVTIDWGARNGMGGMVRTTDVFVITPGGGKNAEIQTYQWSQFQLWEPMVLFLMAPLAIPANQ